MLPHLKMYFLKLTNVKKIPDTKHFKIVKDFLADPLLEAKLGFLMSVCLELEKFLVAFQSNKPMLPFLYSDVYNLMRKLLDRDLKPD